MLSLGRLTHATRPPTHPPTYPPRYLVLSLDAPGQVAIDLRAVDVGLLGRAKAWIALGILVLMLAGIASERVHRMWCSFAAAFAMMAVLLWAGIVPSLAMVRAGGVGVRGGRGGVGRLVADRGWGMGT